MNCLYFEANVNSILTWLHLTLSNLFGLLVFLRCFPKRILILNTDTSVFSAYWYLFSILQIVYWHWYFSIWKSYWILNTSIFILYWSGLWYNDHKKLDCIYNDQLKPVLLYYDIVELVFIYNDQHSSPSFHKQTSFFI